MSRKYPFFTGNEASQNDKIVLSTQASQFFIRRLGAILIDMGIVFGILFLLQKSAPKGIELFQTERSDLTKNILFSLFMMLASVITGGASVGKLIFGLKVKSVDGGKPAFWQILLREFVGRFGIEKSNLILFYILNMNGFQTLLDSMTVPLMAFAMTAITSLPWLTFVSCGFALCSPDGRTLHDRVSGTMLISTRGK